MFERFDHIALEVDDLDEWVKVLSSVCAMRALRSGNRYRTGQRIVLLGDGTGVKIELIEARGLSPSLAHLAFRVYDADAVHQAMVQDGWVSKHAPHDLPAARARTALLTRGQGLDIQIISYQPDSPDIVEWAPPRHDIRSASP